MRILVLGVTGMLGSTVFRLLSVDHDVWGTVRSSDKKSYFSTSLQKQIISNIDVLDQDVLTNVLSSVRPDLIINCVGLIKQLESANDPLVALPINAMFTHRLAKLSGLIGARLVHISTDCVFSGKKGMYVEQDVSDASDLYGSSKFIGELHDQKHCITLRTSIIGHELGTNTSLVDWFLSQDNEVQGFSNAVFSGLPTIELAMVIKNYVIPNGHLFGLFHISTDPIDKYSLLKLIADVYKKEISIVKNSELKIDRSLDSSYFTEKTGYKAKSWDVLIRNMYQFYLLK